MKTKFVFNILRIICGVIGLGMLIACWPATPGAKTGDGFSLSNFFYLAGAFFILWPMLLPGIVGYFQPRAARRITNLKANGIKGKARMLCMARTGVSMNNIPQAAPKPVVKTVPGEHFTPYIKNVLTRFTAALSRPMRTGLSV